MKKLFAILAIFMTLTACTEKTGFGPCIGAFDEKDPKKEYHVSGWNVAMGVIFWELLVPPIVVVINETHCPVGNK